MYNPGPGIDYSCGQSNFDPKTKIHFGVINMNALSEWAWESIESEYPEPTCPHCGCEELIAEGDEFTQEMKDDEVSEDFREDFICARCYKSFSEDETQAEEPCGHVLNEDGYEGSVDAYNDMFITKSPYYTHASYCSPCAPGAGHLENYCPEGPKTYCLGKDWFQDDKCPYPYYSVVDGKLLYAPRDMYEHAGTIEEVELYDPNF